LDVTLFRMRDESLGAAAGKPRRITIHMLKED